MHKQITAAKKDNLKDNKPDYSLLPKIFCDQVSYCMMGGEQKYGRFDYLNGHKLTELTAAAMRHLKARESGEDVRTSNGIHFSLLHIY